MRALGRWTQMWLVMVVAACGGSSAGDGEGDGDPGGGAVAASAAGTGGGGPASGAGGGGGASTGSDGTGTGGGQACPIDDAAKARVESIVQASVGSAGWYLTNSHGHGVFASRGFGVPVPFTTIGVLYAASLAEACDGQKQFDPYCEADIELPISRCSQLICEEAGVLSANVWMEGLPAIVHSDPPPGQTTVATLEHTVHFVETGSVGLALDWWGTLELDLSDGFSARWQPSGTATIDANTELAILSDTIEDVAAEPLVVDVTLDHKGDKLSGEIQHAGAAIALVGDQGVTWTCSP